MTVRSIAHKGVRRLFLRDDSAGVPTAAVDKLRNMLGFLHEPVLAAAGWVQDMEAEDELYALPVWRAHRLSGDRKGTWSLHVTRNWRLTFRIDGDLIFDVDFEDYH